jgi:hypothetical protein
MTPACRDETWSYFAANPSNESLNSITVRLIAAIDVFNDLTLRNNPISIMGEVAQKPELQRREFDNFAADQCPHAARINAQAANLDNGSSMPAHATQQGG